ncbi:MAG: AAA family ATPase [Candidatus Asgardarchaeia archaeon]
MIIKRLDVTNFKSFNKLDIELDNFNVIIGANASGKSNFVRIFEFLRDIANFGLDNAVSMQGGVEYLRNMNIGASEDLSIKIVSTQKFGLVLPLKKSLNKEDLIAIKTYEATYEFALRFNKRGSGFRIVKDKLTQKCEFIELKQKKEKEVLGDGEISIFRKNGKVDLDFKASESVPLKKEDISSLLISPFLQGEKSLPDHTLLLEIPYIFIHELKETFSNIAIYDFDPKLPKNATPIIGKAELEENGSNLSIILKNIAESKEKKRKLFNLIKDLLPFIEDLDVERFADKFLLFKLRERYFRDQYLPASLISDGTINITALIIALYFEKKPLVIIEEPDRNIHPYLISKVVNMMKDASRNKQIIITTHNPEIVKYAGLENILLISRDENGFSKISRPADREDIKAFLKNDIGIEELYVQNLLEA